MDQIAFLFSGQGTQYTGMGQSLCNISPAAKAVFETADKIRPGTKEQCFSGTKEELTITRNTQPCVWCVDYAAAMALKEAGITPSCAAGFSLGEVAAMTFCKVVSPEDGFRAVCRRGELMEKSAEENPGSMAAVLRLSEEEVEEICRKFDAAWPVNYNCPGQIAVSAKLPEIEPLCEAVKEAGGRAVPIKVSGGFHSSLMKSAAQSFGDYLQNIDLHSPELPLYANYTAQPYPADKNEIIQLLSLQICSPVLWQKTIEHMAQAGVHTFIECGPGKTLSGLVKKTLPQAQILRVEDAETLQSTLEALKEGKG